MPGQHRRTSLTPLGFRHVTIRQARAGASGHAGGVVAAPPQTLTGEDRAAIQRRVLRALTGGQIVGAAALGSAVTVGAFVVQDILGQETVWGGAATACFTMGTAVMSQALSRMMLRRGRRPGLATGYALAAGGGLVAAVGAERGWLAVFLLGLFLFGSGQASNLLARYAATDLARPEHRSSAMSRVVFASTFGAVFGPLLVGPTEHAGQAWFGWERYTGPWLFSSVLFGLALANTVARLRPDPLVVAGGISTGDDGRASAPPLRQSLAVIRGRPLASLALAAMVISQATMVGVMTMTPVHMRLHGHESMSQYVISLHIAGMFAFSPLVGRYTDRRGRVPAIVTGAILLVASTVLAALSGDVELLLFPALWGLGLGWCFGLIGGSTLLTESVPEQHRVAVQGSADLLMAFCGGLAGFASGFIRRAVGYHLLSAIATLAAGGLLVLAYVVVARRRRVATLPA
jgi:MFS family permease